MSTDPQPGRRSLPDRPNLRHLKDQAKDLLKAGVAFVGVTLPAGIEAGPGGGSGGPDCRRQAQRGICARAAPAGAQRG